MSIIEKYQVSAAETGNTSRVIHNLTDQKDRKFHWTPLHWASVTDQAQKMRILVQNGADPFIQSNLSFTIIHAAVESNACESLGHALEISKHYPNQLDINQVNVWGETPLIMAAQGCRVDCVKLLLDAGADRNIRQENQQVALHYAGLSDKTELRRETVALLCNKLGSELEIDAQDEDGRPPIFDFLDDTDCLKIFIRHDARLNLFDSDGNSIFHHACIQGEVDSLETLQHLSDDSKDIVRNKNAAGNTPLIEALRNSNIGCAMVLLKLQDVGDMVGQDAWAAIHYAAKLGDSRLLQAVMKHPGFVRGMRTGEGKTARVVAMEAGNWRGETRELLNTYNAIV